MAAASLLALIDDIATILDDVAVLSKVAVQKTAGVLGDDLALNAQQLTGLNPVRELPVVWAVAKGSAVNKVILVPAALLISATLPWLVTPLLMIGGAYLCYEGCEKLLHKFLHRHDKAADEHQELVAAVANPAVDLVAFEKHKIGGAIRTDFILSAEIIVIALGTVKDAPLIQRIGVLIAIAVVMTAGVYGLVGAIVKLDDLGMSLSRRGSFWAKRLGAALLSLAPRLLKFLSIAGTAAMFMVGGGILVHGVHWLYETFHHWAEIAGQLPLVGWLLSPLVLMLTSGAAGVVAGAVIVAVVVLIQKLWIRRGGSPAAAR